MSGVEFMKKLRLSMTDIPGEMLIGNKRLAIGREVLADQPDCDAKTIVEAYRNYGFTVKKAHGKSPQEIADLMERQEYIQATLDKVEQIYRDGEYRPDAVKPKAQIPIEERVKAELVKEPVKTFAPKAESPEVVGDPDLWKPIASEHVSKSEEAALHEPPPLPPEPAPPPVEPKPHEPKTHEHKAHEPKHGKHHGKQ